MTMELTLLSRVACRDQEVTSPRLRGLLALLAQDLRTGASTARPVDGLWPDEQPENPTKALQVLVSRARSQVGAEVIASTPVGYRLALGEDQVDAPRSFASAPGAAAVAQRDPGPASPCRMSRPTNPTTLLRANRRRRAGSRRARRPGR
ncbi:hypothetical protein [Actinophytocola sp.]|uniref:hypothetical protein n=1 Tax=Actinophytocola sp. TaxID=1872138 RepID=UPI0025BF7164|nr:hypothetical protein [Actinophytocola sp.]